MAQQIHSDLESSLHHERGQSVLVRATGAFWQMCLFLRHVRQQIAQGLCLDKMGGCGSCSATYKFVNGSVMTVSELIL